MSEQFVKVRDVKLCFETFGDKDDPALLLVMGLGTQMLAWREGFCEELVKRGFFVIRYDNRDVGRSTRFSGVKPPGILELLRRKPREQAYTLDDMADDGIGLLDSLGIEQAHVVGASMGGMIAQVMAVRHPDRVLSLTSIMSTTGGRFVGLQSPRVIPYLIGKPPADEDAYIERARSLFDVIGSPGFERDDEDFSDELRKAFRRGVSPAGTGRQLGAIVAAGDRTKDLARIKAPTLVIHGSEDKMIAPSGGRATAKAIPGAKLMVIEGMGHDLPRGAWERLADAIAENAARVEQGERSEEAA
jgi:pimeloyl-ACP methyl ester carboxylesterase